MNSAMSSARFTTTCATILPARIFMTELSGVPVMQLAIRDAVERDRLLYNTIGFVGGCLIAILFFRRISFMIIAAAPPLLAILHVARRAGLAQFPAQHVPQRDDAAHHGHQFFRFDAADLRHARQNSRRRQQGRGAANGDLCRRARLRADACDGGAVFRRADIFRFRSHPRLRRSGADRDDHRHAVGADLPAAARHVPAAPGSRLRRPREGRRSRGRCAAPLLRLDRDAHGP